MKKLLGGLLFLSALGLACPGPANTGSAAEGEGEEPTVDTTAPSSSGYLTVDAGTVACNVNLCLNQAANTFHCEDDTKFQLCVGGGKFVVESCPAHLCATRNPPVKNPCIGAVRAAEIDHVPPTPPCTPSPTH